jgi:hypothetical protein
MLASITPLGERGRYSRWGVTMAAFLIGGAAGGAIAGAALGSLGAVVGAALRSATGGGSGGIASTAKLVLLAIAAVIAAAFDMRLLPFGLPTPRRQVDEQWLHRYRGWVYGVGFGFQLGLGFVTIVTTAAVWAAFAAAMLSASPVAGALIGGMFGLARSATLFSVARVRRPEQLVALGRRLRRFEPSARRAAAAALACLALAALAVALPAALA